LSGSAARSTDSQKRAAAALESVGARRLSGIARSNTSHNDVAEVGGGLGGTSGVSKRTDRKCTLVLEDGSVFSGQSFGAEVSIAGEVVFNTGMVGYVENLTDPSYKGQILATTYPLLGNYGVQHSPPDELGLPSGMESDRIHASAVLCQDYCHLPSHWNADKTLSDWLKENNVPGMYGVDTRALTKKLRVHGSMKGKIVMDEDVPLLDPNLVNQVNPKP
jgi:carbamoyl-phosphate synthase small subunit